MTEWNRLIIDERINALVRQTAGEPDGERTPASCAGVIDATVDQAVSSSAGGKRLRALLALDAYSALASSRSTATAQSPAKRQSPCERPQAGRRDQAMLDLACAIEVFQTAALIHDDIIDESELRRGRPAAHRALAMATGSATVGNGLALMLGDVLATASVEIAHRAARMLPNRDAIVPTFLTMHREVEFGQLLDLAVESADLGDPIQLTAASLNVFRWKTASYTTIAPLELALLASGVDRSLAREQALAIGTPLGIAFQLADDLLDVTGSSRNTGKPVGGDIREGKRTVLLADALEAASPADRAWLRSAFEAPSRGTREVEHTMELFSRTGAIERSRRRIADLWRDARQAIAKLDVDRNTAAAMELACARFVPADIR